jgi:alginate O-acetyltransferase complex protein AlgJ
MQALLKYLRYSLPAAYLGYAVFANVWALRDAENLVPAPGTRLADGTAAASFEKAYADALPHREPSIGLLGAARFALLGEGREGVSVGEGGWLFTDEELAVADEETIATAIAQIVAARDLLAYHGTDLVVVPVPAKIDVHRDMAAMDATAQALEDQYASFMAGLAAANVKVVDSRSALAGRRDAFLRTDTHWSPAGAAGVAEAVAQSGLIETGDQAFTAEDRVRESFSGDLVAYVTSAELAPRLGLLPEEVVRFTAFPVAATADTGIFAADAPEAETVLIGTSYSANPRWSFVASLQIALQRDIVNFAAEGQGPAQPMQTYLSGRDFRAAPPDVVIWEFPIRYLADPETWADTWTAPMLTELKERNSG